MADVEGEFIQNLTSGKEALSEGRYKEAVGYLQLAKSQNNSNVYVCRLLGNCYRLLGQVECAIQVYREGISRRYHSGTHSRLLNALNYTNTPQQVILAEHREWARCLKLDCLPSGGFSKSKRVKGKIRVGYSSADFCSHPVAYFLLPIFRAYDRSQFDVVVFSDGAVKDAVTSIFQSLSGRWHDTATLSNRQYQKLVRDEAIDILVDLAGHTTGNRLDVFACRAAPVQVTYLGYPNTTGLATMDYRLVDSITDPFDILDEWYAESLQRMTGCFLCFEPPEEIPAVGCAPFQKNGFVTFGTFNKMAKITDEMIALWVKILLMVPSARMVFKNSAFNEFDERARFIQRFLWAGLDDPSRLILNQLTATRSEHLRKYNDMDIALDTYPYNGTTTTFQAILMGVPVLTLQGCSHVSRVSSSILHNLGLPELVALDQGAYISMASDLAQNPDRLLYYRQSLRKRLLASALVDRVTFVRELEDFYRKAVASADQPFSKKDISP